MIPLRLSPVPHLQTDKEWDSFIKKFTSEETNKILEIGSFFGATLWSFIMNCPYLEKIVSVDLPIPPSDGRYLQMVESRKLWDTWIKKPVSIQGDSHDADIIVSAHKEFPDRDVDILFIDGDHSYEGVRADYYNYQPLVRKGGLIVFHDSVGYPTVRQFTNELKGNTFEINQKPGGWGLFILEKE